MRIFAETKPSRSSRARTLSISSSRVTPESPAGEPKPIATLARAGAGAKLGSRTTQTTGVARKLDMATV
jgi:hypothetical protein